MVDFLAGKYGACTLQSELNLCDLSLKNWKIRMKDWQEWHCKNLKIISAYLYCTCLFIKKNRIMILKHRASFEIESKRFVK